MGRGGRSIRVTLDTRRQLEGLRQAMGAASLDTTIFALLRERRSRVLGRMLGGGRGRVSRFSEADRTETHE